MPKSHAPIRSARRAAAIAAASLLSFAAAQAANFPFSAGFPGINGAPGSPWAYVERDINLVETVLPTLGFSPYAQGGCGPGPCYTPMWFDPSQPNQVPAFWFNNTTLNWQSYGGCCQPVALPPKCAFVHPGRDMAAVIRFKVPAKPNGSSYRLASLKGTITDQDFNGGNGVNWWVEITGSGTVYGGALQSTMPSPLGSAVFPSNTYPVSTGSVINVVVEANTAQEQFDTTAVCGSIVLN